MNQNPPILNNKGFASSRLFKFTSLRNRLLLAFTLLAILPVLITGTTATLVSAQGLRSDVFDELKSVTILKKNAIRSWLEVLQTNLDLIQEDQVVEQGMFALLQNSQELILSQNQLRNELVSFNEKTGYFTEIFVMNTNGEIVVSTNAPQEGKVQANQTFFQKGLTDKYITPPAYEISLSSYSIIISQPIKNRSGRTIGVLAGRVNLATLSNIMEQETGIGEAGETYIVSANYAVLTDLKHINFTLGETYVRTQGVTDAIKNKSEGSAAYTDYAGNLTFGTYQWIPELQIAIIAEHDQDAALQASNRVFQITVGLMIITALLAIFIAFIVTRSITSPITALVDVANKIAQGNIELQAEVAGQDEIGVLAQSFNTMTSRLRDFINTLEQRVADRTKALSTSIEVSRHLSNILDEKQLVTEVVEQIKAAYDYYHGQIYLLDGSGQTLVLAGATGEGGRAMLESQHSISIERGLVGRAARSKSGVLVTDTSQDPDWLPNPLLPDTKAEVAVPILLGDQLLGVIDMQDDVVGDIFPDDVELLTGIANQVAVGLQNARSYAEVNARAEREALISSINQKIQSETSVASALQVAIREVGRATGAQTSVRLKSTSNHEDRETSIEERSL